MRPCPVKRESLLRIVNITAYIRYMGIAMTPYIRLKFWREKANKGRGISQTDLARAVGVSQVLISQIERGEQQSINLELLGKLAKALDCEPRDLVADDGE